MPWQYAVRFMGLGELFAISEPLEDGCELYYEELFLPREAGTNQAGTNWVRDDHRLAAFQKNGELGE